MLKLTGSVLILGSGVLLRYLQAAQRRREMDTLSDLLASLRHMAEEIRMARTPLPVLLGRLAGDCGPDAAAFFTAAADAARRGESLAAAWRQEAGRLPLSASGQAALRELGGSLHGDEESICKAISLVAYSLAQEAEERRGRQGEEARRATALCLSGAALLVILLI